MKLHDIISEMPLRVHNLNVDKNDPSSSFHADDRGIVNSFKGLEKIKRIWQSSVAEVDLYLLDVKMSPGDALDRALGTGFEAADGIRHYGVEFDPEAISVILTNNAGGGRLPLTGWIIAHRLFHCFQQYRSSEVHQANMDIGGKNLFELINVLYEQQKGVLFDLENYGVTSIAGGRHPDYLRRVFCASLIGSTKACRDFRLNDAGELLPECFAQYMLRGRVALRKLPRGKFDTPNGPLWPSEQNDFDMIDHEVESFERFLNRKFAELIDAAKGRVVAI